MIVREGEAAADAALKLPAVGFGGGSLFAVSAEREAADLLGHAFDRGFRYFDTAPFYARGLGEHWAGSALRQRPRDAFVLSTKVGRRLRPHPEGTLPGNGLAFDLFYDYSYDGVLRSFEDSLQRLGLARVDIAFIHDVNPRWHGDDYERRFAEAMEGAYPALARLRSEGVVRAIGVGVKGADVCARFAASGDFDCFMLAGGYTLLEHAALDEFLPLCEKNGKAVIVASPFNSGILATGAVAGARYFYEGAPPEILERTRKLDAICQRHRVPLGAAALQFALAHPAVVSVVCGFRTPQEVDANLAWAATPIPPAAVGRIEARGARSRACTHATANECPGRAMTAATFSAFRRSDGAVGIRNHVLILSVTGLTGPTARRIARAVPGTRVVATPYGSGLTGEDAELQRRALTGFGCHPNVGATLVVGASPPLVAEITAAIGASGRSVESLVLDECEHDAITVTERGIRIVARMQRDVSRLRRTDVETRELFIGMECGRSDPSSGLVANPLVGHVVDAIIAAGGRAVFGETMEWLGAEHLLAARAADSEVARAIEAAVLRREGAAIASGQELLGNNPGPTNIVAGLSTIEEKSLGAIAKGGSSTIRGVVGIAERPNGPGLYLMDAPSYAPESVGGLVASGAQLVLFTTGVGNSFVSGLAPTIKICGNPVAAKRLREQLDFDASGVFEQRESLSEAARRLEKLVYEVASGTLTWGEILDEGDDVVSRLGPAL